VITCPASSFDGLAADLPSLTWRPLRLADVPALHVLVAAAETADGERFLTTVSDLEHDLTAPAVDLERDTIAAEGVDGRLLGWGRLELRTGATWNRIHIFGDVHPDVRRRGLGNAVMDRAERAAGVLFNARAGELDTALPCVLTAHASETAESRARLQERCGFHVVRHFSDMLRPLDRPIPERALPDGYRFVAWSPELDPAFRETHNAAFVDAWGAAHVDAERWNHHFADDPSFRPDLSLGVMAGDELLGYVMVGAWEGLTDDAGLQAAWLALVGVRREHRGRGIASAAMARALGAIRDAGFATAGLDVDTENLGGALRLYEGLGFHPVKRVALRARTVAGPRSA
jgi:ribosomal protein S18 acetylase RimI-like enzyme